MLAIILAVILTSSTQDFTFTCYCEPCPVKVEVDYGAGEGKLEKVLEECEKELKLRHVFTRRVPRAVKAKFIDANGNEYKDSINVYFK